jgi:flagellar basal body-associated protein FliL
MMQSDSAQWAANTISMWALIISVLSFCGAVVSAVIAWMQSKEAKRQAQAGERQALAAEKSLELAQASAAAADLSAVAAQQAVIGALAWVSVNEIKAARASDDRQTLMFQVLVKNFGTSPAHAIRLKLLTDFKSALTEPVEYLLETGKPIEFSVLQSGESKAWDMVEVISREDEGLIKLNKEAYFIHGMVTYLDILDTRHINRFRFVLSLNDPPMFLYRAYTD